jgi:uncharacterized membrane protein YfcA
MILLVCAIVAAAFFVEALTGFGSTVLTVAFGAQLVPLSVLLPALVPVNLAMSLWIVARNHRLVDRRILLVRIVPLMALGFPFGVWAFRSLSGDRAAWLEGGFGLAVAALATFELARIRRQGGAARPLSPVVGASTLVAAGVMHGAYASGGPLVVWDLARRGLDKGVFRATLSALWLLLNTALVIGYASAGMLTRETLWLSLAFVPSLLVGLLVGERAHARVQPLTFHIAVLVLLMAGGLLLLGRNAL